jgi:hypothetical protein
VRVPFKVTAPPRTAPTAPFDFHRTRILTIIFHYSIGNAAMNAQRVWKLLKYCFTYIGHGATVFDAAFLIVKEL